MPIWEENGFKGMLCRCGVMHLAPVPTDGDVHLTSEFHPESYYQQPTGIRLDWIQNFVPTGDLLEVGCGGGHLLAEARSRGFQVTGIDPDPRCVEFARRTYALSVRQSSIEDADLAEGSFDAVFHVDLLSHFPDPVKALKSMNRLVSRDGYVLFEVGRMAGISPAWYRWTGRLGFPEHRWLYSTEGLRFVLDKANLEMVAVKRFGLVATLVLIAARRLMSVAAPSITQRPTSSVRDFDMEPPRLHAIYDALMHFLRYRVGRWMPPVGPLTLLVAARPVGR